MNKMMNRISDNNPQCLKREDGTRKIGRAPLTIIYLAAVTSS